MSKTPDGTNKTMGNDINELNQSNEKKFKAILDQTYSFVGLISLDGRILEANQSSLSFIDKQMEDLRNNYFWDTPWWNHDPELQENLREWISQAAKGEVIRFEVSHPSKDGEIHYFDFSLKPVRDDQGKVFMMTAEGRDISALKHASMALAESRNYLNKIINTVADPIFVKDAMHRWVLLNDAFCSFTGYERETLTGRTDVEFFPKMEVVVFHANDDIVIRTGKETIQEERITNAHGDVRTVMAKKSRYVDEKGEQFIVGIIRDITDDKLIEEQLRQAAKMEAIGTLAGGVAHDFNNMMMAVIGYSELLLNHLGDSDPFARKNILEIKRAGESAAALTQQLLTFSRKQVVQPRVLDVNAVLTNLRKMLSRIIGEDIELETRFGSGLRPIISDPVLIEQVVMNLAINARDAMPMGGKLVIETDNVTLDEAYAAAHADANPGRYVMLTVTDNGMGMSPDTQSHIFEPFYTTKEKGKGTGLGLATVYGIVKQNNGHIRVHSEAEKGTIFKIYLPQAHVGASVEKQVEKKGHVTGGAETILVVEDSETVRNLVLKILKSYGYNILTASGGKNAIDFLETYTGDIDLLVTDVVMPEIRGGQVAEMITAKFPDVSVLFISGYDDNAITRHGVLDADMEFLQKPFTPRALAEKVRRILDIKKQVKKKS